MGRIRNGFARECPQFTTLHSYHGQVQNIRELSKASAGGLDEDSAKNGAEALL